MLLDLHTPTNGYSRTMNAADKKQLTGFGWSWDLSRGRENVWIWIEAAGMGKLQLLQGAGSEWREEGEGSGEGVVGRHRKLAGHCSLVIFQC